MTQIYDCVVVGLGGHGSGIMKLLNDSFLLDIYQVLLSLIISSSAIIGQLAEKGKKVLGVEKYGRVHAHGSSHGRSRIIRQAYYEDQRCKFPRFYF
jgi:hypothetical protein